MAGCQLVVPDLGYKDKMIKPKSAAVSQHMRGIRTRQTGVERRARKVLRIHELKFKGNVRGLPGTPDLVLSDYNVAIFVNGCFWHGCPRCFRTPKHNREWWTNKINTNRRRDRRVSRKLRERGYSVLHLWEHDSDLRMTVRINKLVSRTGNQNPPIKLGSVSVKKQRHDHAQ